MQQKIWLVDVAVALGFVEAPYVTQNFDPVDHDIQRVKLV